MTTITYRVQSLNGVMLKAGRAAEVFVVVDINIPILDTPGRPQLVPIRRLPNRHQIVRKKNCDCCLRRVIPVQIESVGISKSIQPVTASKTSSKEYSTLARGDRDARKSDIWRMKSLRHVSNRVPIHSKK